MQFCKTAIKKVSKIVTRNQNKVNDAAWNLSTSVRESNQTIANSAVAAQERNVKFAQSFLQNGTELLKSHGESTRTLMQTLAEQSQKQQEAFQTLARETWDAYMGFFSSPFNYYQQTLETAESIAWQGVETAQKITRQGMEAAQKVTHQEKQTVHSDTK